MVLRNDREGEGRCCCRAGGRAGAVLIWGFNYIPTKIALQEIEPLTLEMARLVVAVPQSLLVLVARRIRDAVPVPIYHAGGLNPSNVAEAIRQVRPFAVDACSRVRMNDKLDEEILAEFVKEIEGRRER